MLRRPKQLVLAGWGVVVLVAVLMLIVRGSEEAGPAIVFAAVAVAVGAWVWRRGSRASLIASLVFGVLWLLQFAAYTVVNAVDDDVEAGVFVADVVAVVAGVLIVVGAIQALRGRRRQEITVG